MLAATAAVLPVLKVQLSRKKNFPVDGPNAVSVSARAKSSLGIGTADQTAKKSDVGAFLLGVTKNVVLGVGVKQIAYSLPIIQRF